MAEVNTVFSTLWTSTLGASIFKNQLLFLLYLPTNQKPDILLCFLTETQLTLFLGSYLPLNRQSTYMDLQG